MGYCVYNAPGPVPPYAHTRACVYIGKSEPTAACISASGAEGGADGHAWPHASGVEAATVIAAESVTPVVPLNAATVVPDVMPTPEMMQPTQGGLAAALAVSVSAVDEPDVLPTPEPCAVKSPML